MSVEYEQVSRIGTIPKYRGVECYLLDMALLGAVASNVTDHFHTHIKQLHMSSMANPSPSRADIIIFDRISDSQEYGPRAWLMDGVTAHDVEGLLYLHCEHSARDLISRLEEHLRPFILSRAA